MLRTNVLKKLPLPPKRVPGRAATLRRVQVKVVKLTIARRHAQLQTSIFKLSKDNSLWRICSCLLKIFCLLFYPTNMNRSNPPPSSEASPPQLFRQKTNVRAFLLLLVLWPQIVAPWTTITACTGTVISVEINSFSTSTFGMSLPFGVRVGARVAYLRFPCFLEKLYIVYKLQISLYRCSQLCRHLFHC